MRNIKYDTPPADAIINLSDLSGRDSRWTQRAIGLSLSSSHTFPMGALAITGGSLVGHATNRYRNSPRTTEWTHCSTHAEAALAARFNLKDTNVYVARTLTDGTPALAKPCLNCLHTLTAAGVRRVIWTESETEIGWMNLG